MREAKINLLLIKAQSKIKKHIRFKNYFLPVTWCNNNYQTLTAGVSGYVIALGPVMCIYCILQIQIQIIYFPTNEAYSEQFFYIIARQNYDCSQCTASIGGRTNSRSCFCRCAPGTVTIRRIRLGHQGKLRVPAHNAPTCMSAV